MFRLKKNNAKGARANVDAVHDKPNNNLTYYHNHNGRCWDVPENFIFPKNMLLKHGWIAWLKGFPENRECNDEVTMTKLVKPLR